MKFIPVEESKDYPLAQSLLLVSSQNSLFEVVDKVRVQDYV